MSLSINNPPFANVDTSSLSGQLPAALKVDIQPKPQTTHSNVHPAAVRNETGELMVSAGALAKVLDMLEQFFKSMREMFLGKNVTPDALPVLNNLPKVKPDTGKLPVKPDAADQPIKPAPDKPAVKPGTTDQPVKPDTGKLPVKPDAPKPLGPVVPAVPKPAVEVTNDAKANIQVNVNVSHCHCPGDERMPRVTPDVRVGPNPGVRPTPQPGVEPGVRPTPKPNVPPIPKSEVTPRPAPDAVPDTKPEVRSDKPVPDLTSPGPAENRFDSRHWRFNTPSSFRS